MLVSQHPYVSDVLLAVLQVPDTLVFHVAGLAPRLADPSLAILEAEFFDRLFDAAPSAPARLGRLHRTCILSHQPRIRKAHEATYVSARNLFARYICGLVGLPNSRLMR